MVFSFSFSLSVPGIANPFTAAAAAAIAEETPSTKIDNLVQPSVVPRRRPPSPSLLPPLSKKRGWVPSDSELSRPAPMHTSTSGYLDTPAKYRAMAHRTEDQDQGEIEELVADLPPPKRRRTLAGSIISTALSAALIGTAVGLTVYRLWRDRGKNPEALPPPPYEQGEWVPPESETRTPADGSNLAHTPRSRKSRPVTTRRTVPRHRKTHPRSGPSVLTYASPSRLPIPPEFNFASGSRSSPKPGDDADVDEQMSWIGGRLAHLIVEGQKALGKEVVIMSEDQADEVDDGAGDWVEEDARTPVAEQRVGLGLPPYSPHTPQFGSLPRRSRFDRDASVESDVRSIASNREEESAWNSPEMRESMERARTLYRQKRGFQC